MIFSWWKIHKRDLPWRKTHDPYKILVSEIMLQQTQVQRVIPKYTEFIEVYPSVSLLAEASTSDILRVWRGMGYNRRALYLHQTARIIVKNFQGYFPKSQQLLVKLPGVGTYTARAVLVFAFQIDTAAVDTNIEKIITHFFFKDIPQKPGTIQGVADKLLPKGKSWEWHQALMDYGALEHSKIKRPERSRRTSIRFRDSNRFYRGRIMDRLREKDMKESQLINELYKKYKKPKDSVGILIKTLEREGLIARTKGNVLSLPS